MSKELTNPDPALILSNIHDGLVLLDLEGRVRYANQIFLGMTGRTMEELEGLQLCDVFDEQICMRIDPGQLSLPHDSNQVHFNVELPGNDGVPGSYCFSATVVKNAEGQPIGLLENFRDMKKLRNMILQLQEVNQAIQHEKDRTQQIVDSIADGIFTVNRDRLILSFSGKMELLTGIRSEEAIGRSCSEVLKGTKCETDCPLRWSFEHQKSVERCREELRSRHGKHIPVTITTAFLNDESNGSSSLIGVVRDYSEEERLRRKLQETYSYRNIVGQSPAMKQVFQAIQTVADTDVTVLIQGETGAGKDLVAQAIHNCSPRKDRPFVMLNCAALNDNLLESELFGHMRGAFTGAIADRPGRFELAAGGTLFLDEIGDTSPAMQSKLLRALEEKTFERVGDTRTRKVDVRIIAATHHDLRKLVTEGRFREDLYFRLTVMPVHLPPLRDRKEDIPLLAQHFMNKYRPRYFAGREDQFEGISNRALALLLQYHWPGNVRELEHAIEHAMISTTTGRIERIFLPEAIRKLLAMEDVSGPSGEAANPGTPEAALRSALERHHWNATETAQALGISRTTLWRRMRKLDLSL